MLNALRRRATTQWTWARVLELLAINAYWSLRIVRHRIDVATGTHANRSPDDSVAYIERVFGEYKRYGGIEHFTGVGAEIGPGDNAGVALLMRQDGCERVDLIERYIVHADREQQEAIFRLLSQLHNLDSLRTSDSWDNYSFAGVVWQPPQPAEAYFQRCPSETYDIVVSRTVLEQVQQPLGLLTDIIRCLRPGGSMIHQIDLSDIQSFSRGHDELTWLSVPSWVWPLLSSNGMVPNRILLHRYRELLESCKQKSQIEYEIIVSHLVSVGEIIPACSWSEIPRDQRERAVAYIEANRARLAPEFRDVPAEDLAAAAVFLTVRKRPEE